MQTLRDGLREWQRDAAQWVASTCPRLVLEQVGEVVHVGDGIATVRGLPDVRSDELMYLGDGVPALAWHLEEDIGCVLLGDPARLCAGNPARGSGRVASVPVGETLLGRVVSPLGEPLDGAGPLHTEQWLPIERPAPGILDRALVTEPLYTGITVVDATIPLGRGQRELIIGDRKTGKTAIAIDTIIRQRDNDVICVYASVGQKASTVNQVLDELRTRAQFDRCLVVVGAADAAPGAQWLTPYAACTMAEWFRDRGRHCLLVIDDLTRHAALYRELSLLLRSPPGREAYPGDVFYMHARLLERAARLAPERGGGSLTVLAVAETQAGNLTAYIPTNLVSITDGQIYLEPQLFNAGQKPAVNVGKSVSRVGGKTQPPALRGLAESLRLDYAQFVELEAFTHFGTVMDDRTRQTLEHGRRVRAVFTQPRGDPLSLSEEVILLVALSEGVLDEVPLDRIERVKRALRQCVLADCGAIVARIDATARLSDEDRRTLAALARSIAAEG